MKTKMKRTQIYLTEKEYMFLQDDSKNKEISISDIIRRIIDNYYDKCKEK